MIDNPYGFLFTRVRFTSDAPAGTVFLGRPWHPSNDPNAIGQVLVRDSWIGDHIGAVAWSDFSGGWSWRDARFAEHHNRGPGALVTADRPQLTPAEAAPFTVQAYLTGARRLVTGDASALIGRVFRPSSVHQRDPVPTLEAGGRVRDDVLQHAACLLDGPHRPDVVGRARDQDAVEPDLARDAQPLAHQVARVAAPAMLGQHRVPEVPADEREPLVQLVPHRQPTDEGRPDEAADERLGNPTAGRAHRPGAARPARATPPTTRRRPARGRTRRRRRRASRAPPGPAPRRPP